MILLILIIFIILIILIILIIQNILLQIFFQEIIIIWLTIRLV